MSRRTFLTGLASTAVIVGTIPSLPTLTTTNAELWYKQWLIDLQPVMENAWVNLFLYGTAAYEQIDEYPYLRSVAVNEIYEQT